MTDVKLMLGNCLDRLKDLDDNSVDSIVTDPPYGIDFMGKKWDYDVPSTEIWEQALRVLKPGGYLLAFAGTRTQHRMAVRIEDAGFEIRDMIAWVYGSGFPKSHNISKSLDKMAGAEREIVGKREHPTLKDKTKQTGNHLLNTMLVIPLKMSGILQHPQQMMLRNGKVGVQHSNLHWNLLQLHVNH